MANELHFLENVLFYNVTEQIPYILADYSFAGQILDCVKEHPYNYFKYNFRPTKLMTFALHINHIVSKAAKVLNCECETYSTLTKPAQYAIHTSTTKSIYVIDRIYSVEQLTGRCVIMIDIYVVA